MSPDERWFPSHLTEIGKAECLELLASHRVGRVAYCDELGPVVLPVNYVLDHDTVLIQILPHSTLATHLRAGPASLPRGLGPRHGRCGHLPGSARRIPASSVRAESTSRGSPTGRRYSGTRSEAPRTYPMARVAGSRISAAEISTAASRD